MFVSLKNLFIFYGIFLTTATYANESRINYYFNLLKNQNIPLYNHGPLCEHIARIILKKQLPIRKYIPTIGIVYQDQKSHQIIGELDIVVFEQKSQEAEFVFEVKCQKDLHHAHRHALEQLQRFVERMHNPDPIHFYRSQQQDENYKRTQFDENPFTGTIGPQGAVTVGFDKEIDLSLDDVLKLHKKLLGCRYLKRLNAPLAWVQGC